MKSRILKIFLVLFFVAFIATGCHAFSFRNMTLDFVHRTDTHITDKNSKDISMWYEPSIGSLVKQFKNFYNNHSNKEIEDMVSNAEALIKKEFSTDVIGPSKYNFYEYLLAKFDKY